MMTVPAPAKHRPAFRDQGEPEQPGPDPELAEATRQAVENFEYLASRHQAEGFPDPEPGPAYRPPDYGTMLGKLICRNCGRPIRDHHVGEWH